MHESKYGFGAPKIITYSLQIQLVLLLCACNGPFHRFDRESQSKCLAHCKQFIYTRSILIRIPTIYISPRCKTHVDALKGDANN